MRRTMVLCVVGVGLLTSAVCPAVWAQTTPAPPPAPTAAPAPATTETQLAALQKKMNDWAQLSYFTAQNASLPAPAAGEQRVVFYGDSITQGWGRPGNWFPASKPYIDRGISGQTSAQMVVRFHQDVVNLHPAAVIILAGTNDVAGNTGPMTPEMTLDNIRAMTEMAQANGIKVVLCSITPTFDFPWRKGLEPAPKIRALNTSMEAYAKSAGAVWVDYYSALADTNGGMKPGLSLDGVHPTPAGYALMDPLAEAGIAKALSTK
jgi:lysophospholipase L1-like esterase